MVLWVLAPRPSMRDGLPDALVRKCEDGDAAVVAAWLDEGGSINMRQDFGLTPWRPAASRRGRMAARC